MDAHEGNRPEFRREGDAIIINTEGLPTCSWPVPDPDADHEYYLQVSVYGQDCAVEVRSDSPITIEAMRRIADELAQVASSLEAELPAL